MIATLLKHEYLRTRTLLGLLLGVSLAVVGFETNFADAFAGEGNDDVMPLGFLPVLVLVAAVFILLVYLVVDILYELADPRIQV